jgi:hypothetical protein
VLFHTTTRERGHARPSLSVLSFANSTSCSVEALKLCYVFECWVNLKISESPVPSTNGVTIFVCPPRDRNTTRSSGQPSYRSASGSEDRVCKMFNHPVNTSEFAVVKWYRLSEALPVTLFVMQFARRASSGCAIRSVHLILDCKKSKIQCRGGSKS